MSEQIPPKVTARPVNATDLTLIVVDMEDRFCKPAPDEWEKARHDFQVLEKKHWDHLPSFEKQLKRAKNEENLARSLPLGNDQTQKLSEKMPEVLTKFREAGSSIIHVCSGHRDLDLEKVEFAVRPEPIDLVVQKRGDSIFDGSGIEKILRTRHLALCGVNLNACVRASATEAVRKGYKAYVLLDLSANDRFVSTQKPGDCRDTLKESAVRSMRKAGIVVTNVPSLLDALSRPITIAGLAVKRRSTRVQRKGKAYTTPHF